MEHRTLGKSSLKPSVLGLGGLHFGVFSDEKQANRIVRRALDLGINFIDTAPLYGNGRSESFIRQAIGGRRQEVILATKVGLEPRTTGEGMFGVAVAPLDRAAIRASLERSLRELGTDCIDLFQLHAFNPEYPPEETLSTLDQLVAEGKIRFTGCSNYDSGQLNLMMGVAEENGWAGFTSLQAHYNLIERRCEKEIVPACRARGIGVVCNRALARGVLTGKYKWNRPYPEGSRAQSSVRVRRCLAESTLGLVEKLDRFAQERGWTSTALAVAWLLAQPGVSVVLAGVRDVTQLEACIRATQWHLSREDLGEIDRLIGQTGLLPQLTAAPETFLET